MSPTITPDLTCKAGGRNGNHHNYGKPCVPAPGVYDGNPRSSCVYCGKWLEKEKQ